MRNLFITIQAIKERGCPQPQQPPIEPCCQNQGKAETCYAVNAQRSTLNVLCSTCYALNVQRSTFKSRDKRRNRVNCPISGLAILKGLWNSGLRVRELPWDHKQYAPNSERVAAEHELGSDAKNTSHHNPNGVDDNLRPLPRVA